MKKIMALILTLLLVFTFASCSNDEYVDNGDREKEPTENQPELLQLTLDDLLMYNGQDGAKAYVAVEGNVYDVSDIWESGEHNGYMAGTDITSFISSAPHGISVIDDLEKVGEIIS